MKNMKKIVALLLATVMVMAMSINVFAATTVTIDPKTPAGATNTPTYTYYVMMKASVGENDAVSYYVETEALATALDGLKVGEDDLFTVTKASGAERWNVTINEKYKSDGEAVATALQSIKDNAIATGTATDNKIELEYDAYILIESSLGTKLVLDTVTTKTVEEKNTYPSVTKTEDISNAEIGQEVTYTIPVVIPATVAEKDITVVDTITKGLTLNTTIEADQGVTGLAWTLDSTGEDGSKVYKVVIPAATVQANAGKTITLTYKAKVNENAVVKEEEKNKAHVEYDNFTSVDTPEVKVKTFGFDLMKTDGSNALKGVKFTLQNSANEYYTVPSDESSVDEDRFVAKKSEVVTPEDGKITFAGLAAGTYTLTETETVDGFNLLTGPITVVIDAEGNATFTGDGATGADGTVTIVNNKGAVLPSTGGIGTTMFYVVGSVLVIGAAVVLISKRRMAR